MNQNKIKTSIIIFISAAILLFVFFKLQKTSDNHQVVSTNDPYDEYVKLDKEALPYPIGVGLIGEVVGNRMNLCDSIEANKICINVPKDFAYIDTSATKMFFVKKLLDGSLYKIPVTGDQDVLQEYTTENWIYPKIKYYEHADSSMLIQKLSKGTNSRTNVYFYPDSDACTIGYDYFVDPNLPDTDFPYWLKISYVFDTGCDDKIIKELKQKKEEYGDVLRNMDIQIGEYKLKFEQ